MPLERITQLSSSRVTHKAVSYQDMPCLEFRQVFPQRHSNPVFKPSYLPWSIDDFINRSEELENKFAKASFAYAKQEQAKIKDGFYFKDTPENRYMLKQVGMSDEQIEIDQIFEPSSKASTSPVKEIADTDMIVEDEDEDQQTEAEKTIEKVQMATSQRLKKVKPAFNRATTPKERMDRLVCMEDEEISTIIFNRMQGQKRRKAQRAKRAQSVEK